MARRRRAVRRLRTGTGLLAAALVLAGCGDDADGGQAVASGEQLFDTHCAQCHGQDAAGTTVGPPLVHKIYEPSHHSDDSFRAAVANGVVPHHWDFGPMPAVPSLGDREVEAIITYVRGLQEDAGIR